MEGWFVVALTAVLVAITAWYAKLTRDISASSRDSADASRDAAEHSRRAADTAERAAALTAERHRDDQLRRFTLSFDADNEKLVLTNASTTKAWDKVVIGIVNHMEGPLSALGDGPPEPVGEPPHHFINLGGVEAGDVRPIDVVRASEHVNVPVVVKLRCWQGDDWWPVLLSVDVPPPPPVPWVAFG